jgi:hypothetical protein
MCITDKNTTASHELNFILYAMQLMQDPANHALH